MLTVGSNATNDEGIGLATVLGFRFLDEHQQPLPPIDTSLGRISSINTRQVTPLLAQATCRVMTDVTNPFYGPEGAAHVFAAHKGDLEHAEADRLASEALLKKGESETHVTHARQEQEKFEKSADQLNQKVPQLKQTISQRENELKILKARQTVSTATQTINKQLAQTDSPGTVALLERMKDKVAKEDALAESYGVIANESKSLGQEIDKALATNSAGQASEGLRALKAMLGLTE